jgi:DUF1365 family protein
VAHRRTAPTTHRFTSSVSLAWFDPDDPSRLCGLHPAWSDLRPAPVRYRRRDYGGRESGSLADEAREDIGRVRGQVPRGPVRMLSQLRRWGWLFNPITFFFVWDVALGEDAAGMAPVGVVLEVTNTPWKERTRYPLVLERSGSRLVAEFDKAMHVSPFLGLDHRYRLAVADRDDGIVVDIDVLEPNGSVILHTALRTGRSTATRSLLGRSLRTRPAPTHRVSAGIHAQAARLRAKRVPVVPHPKKSGTEGLP